MSSKYRIETDNGTYEVEVDDSGQSKEAYQPSRLETAASVISGAMQFIDSPGGQDMSGVNTLEPKGQDLFNRMGGAVSESLGKKYPDHPYMAAVPGTVLSLANPQNWIAPKVGPGLMPGQGPIREAAQNLGRRSIGINKPMLNRMKGGIPQANQAAQEMLDKGVIKPFSGARATLGRAEEVAATSGKSVGDALAKTGNNALDTSRVSEEIINQLAPEFQGGAYAGQENVANEIIDTIRAHGEGPIDFESAQQLKNTLKQMAGSNWNTDKIKASLYQRAYGIVSDEMERNVASASPASAPDYLKNKKTYGASQTAIRGLEDRANAEASNSLLSLRGAAIGAGALASGHITPALEALGLWEGARRVGSATGAYALNKIASPVSGETRRAALAAFINKVTTNQGTKENR